SMVVLRRIGLLCAFLRAPRAASAALQADELLLICNKNIPSSLQSAEFYAKSRLVPQGRILALNLPASEEISFDKYEQEFVPAVRDFLRANHLEDKVRCIVTFFGVPFRIAGHQRTPDENNEIEAIKKEAADVYAKAAPAVDEVEVTAKELNPAFTPLHGR